jgi:hypothetical protein
MQPLTSFFAKKPVVSRSSLGNAPPPQNDPQKPAATHEDLILDKKRPQLEAFSSGQDMSRKQAKKPNNSSVVDC